MKIFLPLIVALFLLVNFCQVKNIAESSENTQFESKSMTTQDISIKKFDDLEISYKINFSASRLLNIDYTIKNKSAKDYIIFNQGHTNRQEINPTYVEETSDGMLELSQKAFSKPQGIMCPNSLVPIMPRGLLLKAGTETTGKAEAQFPLQTFTPYDFCIAPKPVDDNVKQAKFCLGVVKIEDAEVKIDEKGNIEGVNQLLAKQNILCSDLINLK